MRLKGKKRRKKKGLGYVGRKDEWDRVYTGIFLLGNSDNGAIKRNLEVTKNIQLG